MATSLLRRTDARAVVRFMQQTGIPFELVRSNYTMEIKSELINDKFVNSFQSKQTFAAFAKIKSDIKNKPIPDITRDDLVYFQHNFRQSFIADRVSNIDLSSAYATVLYNSGLLSDATFKYLSKLPKQSRLVSVGMLASRKKIFSYRKGQVSDYQEIVSDLSPFFYLAVRRTFEIMSELKQILSDDYLFTWVDGIYFKPNASKQKECEEYLRAIKFGFKSETLQRFEVRFLPRKILLQFRKWSEAKEAFEIKMFNLPHKETITQKIALSIIKSKQNEKVVRSKISR